ncbi:MAG: SDR family NAD(P)-dependent oxidoreductase [candidate division Zixibacteria bacterium]|nr:SDR family NAD(P)-dependent oxidoreductase [candidate division Zixibacteria bacterium]MDD5426815.1 SDR family NAD(P)-dependent oxidoreductase [candidate division Zixibacteria bacterium]
MADSEKKTILITGANGFIGSRLCRKFIEEDFRVIAGVRKTSDLSLLDGLAIEYRYGDVTRPDSLPAMVTGVDYIIHNAGLVKAKKRKTFFEVNESGTRNLFEAVLEHNPGIKKIVYLSSLAAAGPSVAGRPVTEYDTPHPLTIYGESKLAGERVARSYENRLNVTIVRPPGVYGPGDKEFYDLFKTVYRHLRPIVGDSRRKIQLVYVDDLCEGIYKTITTETRPGAVYFICENRPYTMSEMMVIFQKGCRRWAIPLAVPGWLFKTLAFVSEHFFKLFGATPFLTVNKAAELLADWSVATEKARLELGFESRVPLDKGVRATYEWYLEKGWL